MSKLVYVIFQSLDEQFFGGGLLVDVAYATKTKKHA